jgi:hypothetical protein
MSAINKIITHNLLMAYLAVVERWYGENKNYRKIFMDYVINKKSSEWVTNPEF